MSNKIRREWREKGEEKIKKVQQQQMLGEVRTVSKKDKRVREEIREWGKGKQQKQLGGEETVSEKDRRCFKKKSE